MKNKPRIKIVGAGPTGLTLAHALSTLNFNVDIYDLKDIHQLSTSDRAYAITHSSRRILQELSLWDQLKPYLIPFSNLEVFDTTINDSFLLQVRDLKPENKIYQSIGWIIEHSHFTNVIIRNIQESSTVNFLHLDNSNSNYDKYDFCIACDGSKSKTRDHVNINTIFFSYKKVCIVSRVLIRGISKDTAYECFRKDGPLAILPLKGDLFNVLWTLPLKKANRIEHYSNSEFLDNLNTVLPYGIEVDCLIAKPQIVPLTFSISRRIFKSKTILAGESCHTLHPVGGQGLNLSLRDIENIYNLFKFSRFTNHFKLELPYSLFIERKLDILFTSVITNLLVLIFSNNNPLMTSLRRIVFFLLKSKRFIKRIVISLMTDGPNNLFK